jgi:hypothetical protein
MQTWLDFYTNGAKEAVANGDRLFETGAAPAPAASDYDAMRRIIGHSMRILGLSNPMLLPDWQRNAAIFWHSIAPYFRRAGDRWQSGSALQLSAELVGDLVGARVPDSDCWLEQLKGGAWYIDLPHNSLLVGENLQARAIFSLPSTEGSSVAMNTILTRPGSNKIVARLSWKWGEKPVAGFALADFDVNAVRDCIENLAALALLYKAVAGAEHGADLPHKCASDMARNPRREARVRKKFSLFRVRRLSSPPEGFGGRHTHRQGGWQIAVRHKVSWHFKLQPHGPQRSLRKLVRIEGYERGPADGIVRPDLHVL